MGWSQSLRSIYEAVFEKSPDGLEGIPDADLLSFGVLSRIKRNGHLKNACFALEQFGRDFGFKIEALGAKGDALDDIPAKNLVAGLHVGEDTVVKQVGGKSEEAVGHHVPEHRGAAGCSQETGTKDYVGLALLNGNEQRGIFPGIIFKVRVLYDDHIGGGGLKAGPDGRALPLVLRLEDELNARIFGRKLFKDGGGVVH